MTFPPFSTATYSRSRRCPLRTFPRLDRNLSLSPDKATSRAPIIITSPLPCTRAIYSEEGEKVCSSLHSDLHNIVPTLSLSPSLSLCLRPWELTMRTTTNQERTEEERIIQQWHVYGVPRLVVESYLVFDLPRTGIRLLTSRLSHVIFRVLCYTWSRPESTSVRSDEKREPPRLNLLSGRDHG